MHNIYLRIDLFLISNSLIPGIRGCSIGDMIISDHAQVSLDLMPQGEEAAPIGGHVLTHQFSRKQPAKNSLGPRSKMI